MEEGTSSAQPTIFFSNLAASFSFHIKQMHMNNCAA